MGKSIKVLVVGIIMLIVGVALGGWRGYSLGYRQAQIDAQAEEAARAKKSTEEAAKAANPFRATNPLEGVEANPFEKVKKILNPF